MISSDKNRPAILDQPESRRLEFKESFPKAKIECARFKGTDKRVFLDQLSIEGPIHDSVEPCMTFIKKNIALGATIGEIYRKDRWEYPLEAIGGRLKIFFKLPTNLLSTR